MSKADGEKILITFDEDLTAVGSNADQHFQIQYQTPTYVPGGAMETVTKVPASIDYAPSLNSNVDLAQGSFSGVVCADGVLSLDSDIGGIPIEDKFETSSLSGSKYTSIGVTFKCKISGRIVSVLYKVVTAGAYTFTIYDNSTDAVLISKSVNIAATGWTTVSLDSVLDVEQNNEYRLIVTTPSSKFYRTSPLYNGTFWQCLKEHAGSGQYSETPALGFAYQTPSFDPSGTAEYTFTAIRELTGAFSGYARWSQDEPEGTDVTVEAKLNDGAWQTLTNGADLPINWSAVTASSTLYIRVTLETEDDTVTPTFAGLQIVAFDQVSKRFAVLTFPSGNVNGFRNAAGDITLTYDGAGGLEGEGGPVENFEETFTPIELVPKPNQNNAEHIELSLIAIGTLTRIYHTNTQEREHISLAVSASGVLTHVDDI